MSESDHAQGLSGDRHCGACTACCVHLTIPAGLPGVGHKPSGTPCPHAGALGCRIHARRPRICADLACGWLRNALWPPTWRPDRSGLLCLEETLPSDASTVTVIEIQSGALLKAEAAEIVRHLLQSTVSVSIVNGQGQRESLLGRTAGKPTAPLPRRLAG